MTPCTMQIFWSLGNLYTAWADLMKQALAAAQAGSGFQVDANQILQCVPHSRVLCSLLLLLS